ncbi:unnamed protein product [Camellia sinensis]
MEKINSCEKRNPFSLELVDECHYVEICGYDAMTDEFEIRDPASSGFSTLDDCARNMRRSHQSAQKKLANPLELMKIFSCSYEVNSRGVEIFTKSWLPKTCSPKAIIYYCHGYGDTCTFLAEGIARKLVFSGYGVFAMDYPGFGLSKGLHGYIPSFDILVDDVIEQYSKTKATLIDPISKIIEEAALEAPRILNLNNNKYFSGPYGEDVVFIANDWHTALLPCYLKTKYKPMGIYKNARLFSASITLPTKGDFLLQTSLFSIFRNNLRALLILLIGMTACQGKEN